MAEYGEGAEALARLRQDAMNWASRLKTGQASLEDTSPHDLYMNVTALTGRKPEELPAMRQNIEDVQAGLETGNQGLVLQGVNGMMGPSLKKGIGGPSPYGGTIVRKEIIGLDPARSADGADHPDKFIPRLRVFVEKDGKTMHYDAPVTKNRSTDPDDPVVAVNMGDAMDFMGNMSVLTTALEHPEVKAKLEEGAKTAGKSAQKYIDELQAASRPAKKTSTRERVDLGDRVVERELDSNGKIISEKELKKGAVPKVFRPPSGGGGAKGALQAKLDAIDAGVEDGTFDEDEAATMKKSVLSGIKPGTGKGGKGPSNAEQTSLIRDAENAAATALGMKYDASLKQHKNLDGTPATTQQLAALNKARDAAAVVVRAAAAEGRRPNAADMQKAVTDAKPPESKYESGKTYTNAKGQKAKFGGVDPQGKNIWLAP